MANLALSGYAAIDGSFLTLPERKDLGSDEIPPPTDEACIEFVELVEKIEERRLEMHAAYVAKHAETRSTLAPPACPIHAR